MEYTYKTRGVCSMQIRFEIDYAGKVHNVRFMGGCNGNTQGVAALSEGRSAQELTEILSGIDCGGRGTSCPDQFARALREALA